MIRVLCLNPTIDRNYYIDSFEKGGAYHGTSVTAYPGGKGLNIAKVLKSLGNDEVALYLVAGGHNGEWVEEVARENASLVRVFRHEGETRTTINIMDRKNGTETEIKESGVTVPLSLEKEFLETLDRDLKEGDLVIASGTAISGLEKEIYRKVSEICCQKNALMALDANGKYLENAFPGHYFFLKPNAEELKALFSLEGEMTRESVVECARKLQKNGVDNVLVTLGKDGGVFVGGSGTYYLSVPEVEVVSTIGSGDSTVAGFCHAYLKDWDIETILSFALACGTANAKHDEVGCVKIEEVALLQSLICIERTSRTKEVLSSFFSSFRKLF